MSARSELNGFDRIAVRHAREALAASESLDMSDDVAMARMIGRLEVVLADLLKIVDKEEDQ